MALDVALDGAAAPFANMVSYAIATDGMVAQRFPYGAAHPTNGHVAFDLGASEWSGAALGRGATNTTTRHVTLSAHIAGASTDPTPIELDAPSAAPRLLRRACSARSPLRLRHPGPPAAWPRRLPSSRSPWPRPADASAPD